jgi:hypothetical protein
MELGDVPEINILNDLFDEQKYEDFFRTARTLSNEKMLNEIALLFENYAFDDKDYSVFLTQLFNELTNRGLMSKISLYLEKDNVNSILEVLNEHHLTEIAISLINSLTKDAEQLNEYLSDDLLKNEDLAFAAFNHAKFKKGASVGLDSEFFEPYEETIHKILLDNNLFEKYQNKLSDLKISPASFLYLISKSNINELMVKTAFSNYEKYLNSNLDMLEELKQELFINSEGKTYFNKLSYRELLCHFSSLMSISNQPNSLFAKHGLNNEFLLSKLREASFNSITEFCNIDGNTKYYKDVFNLIASNPSYNENLAQIDYQVLMDMSAKRTSETLGEGSKKKTKHYGKNDFALYYATELANKYPLISHTHYEGHNALTLYVDKIAQISSNNKELNSHQFFSSPDEQKAQEPLNTELLKVFYKNNPKLFLQADSFGKYPWNYLTNENISAYAKFNDSTNLKGPLHQFEIFLESIDCLQSYEKIKEFESNNEVQMQETQIEAPKKLSFFSKLLNSFFMKTEKNEIKEVVLLEKPKEDVVSLFNQKLEQSKSLLNDEVLNKMIAILNLSTEIYALTKDDKNAIETNILIKNTLKNYLPTIIDNFIAMNELKSNSDDTQATKITLEQLNVLDQKLISVKEETNQMKKSSVMADVESFGSFLNSKTQKTMKM